MQCDLDVRSLAMSPAVRVLPGRGGSSRPYGPCAPLRSTVFRRQAMSIFRPILTNIFTASPPAVQAASTPDAAPAAEAAPASAPAAAPAEPVDVEAVLTALAEQNSEKLNWRTSIVDLMKLLSLDSGLGARKQLAEELDYSGDMND